MAVRNHRLLGFRVAFLAGVLVLSSVTHVAQANGTFQVEILGIENLRSDRPDGDCCRAAPAAGVAAGQQHPPTAAAAAAPGNVTGSPISSPGTDCSRICRPYLRLCFKQFQRNVVLAQDCILEGLSPVLALPLSTTLQGNNTKVTAIDLPFQFGWMKSYTMIMELLDAKGAKANRTLDRLLEQGVQSEEITPGPVWKRFTHVGKTAIITYQLRVTCDEFYGNVTCMAYCKPRNDPFGHSYCDSEAQMVCLDGWNGPNCEKAICSSTCQNGICSQPGECRCRPGWQGEDCDKCLPHVACKHGKCQSKPWECVCEPGWGGPMCDRDLNYCGRNKPCFNYAVCHNTGEPTLYECRCPEGFSGTDCNEVVDPCQFSPACQNAGQCFNKNGTAQCRCAAGWSGATCDRDIDECDPNPCQGGAPCLDEIAAFKCLCPEGFAGATCDDDVRSKVSLPLAPEITSINFLQGRDRAANASIPKTLVAPDQPTDSPSTSVHDDSAVVITVVLSLLLVLAVLFCVLMSLFFYRRRQKLRQAQTDSINSDKYGCGTSNNRQQTKDLLHNKDVSDVHVIRCNQENEARLKILNNIFTPTETKLPVSDDDVSDISSDSLRKMNVKSFPPAADMAGVHVRYVSEPPDAQISAAGYDPYWNNRDRPTLYANKDTKNYMESVRRGMLDGSRSSTSLSASPLNCSDSSGKQHDVEDFTVV